MEERNKFARVISPPSGSTNSIGSNKSSSTTETTTTTTATMDRKPAAGTLPNTNNIDGNEHHLKNSLSENLVFPAPTRKQLQSVQRRDQNTSRRVNSVSSTEDVFLNNDNDAFFQERGSHNNFSDFNHKKLDNVQHASGGDRAQLESFDSPTRQQKPRHPAENNAALLSQMSPGGSQLFHDDYYLSPPQPHPQTSVALLPSQPHHLLKPAPSNTSISTTRTTSSSTHVLVPSRPNGFLDAEYWWAVDLMHDPPLQQGATPLVKRCMLLQTDWDEAFARIVLKAYKQFLAIVKYAKDWTGQKVMAPYFVKRMWQVHALDVVSYSHDCMLLCGHVVGGSHIEERDELSSEEQHKRQVFTMGILENKIDASYDEKIWSYDALEEEEEDMNADHNEERQERSNSLAHGYVSGSRPKGEMEKDDEDDDDENSNSSSNNDADNVKEVALNPNGSKRSAKNTSGDSDNHSCASLLTPDTELDSSPFLEISVRRGSVASWFKLRQITKMRKLFKNIPYDKFGVNRENARLYLPARDERSEPTEIHPSHTVESLRLRDGDKIYLDEVAFNNNGEDNDENEMDEGDARGRHAETLSNPEQPGANDPPVADAPAAAPIIIVVDDDEIATKEEPETNSSSSKVASADAKDEKRPKNVDNEIKSKEEVIKPSPNRVAIAETKKKKKKRPRSKMDDEITTEEEVIEPTSDRVTRADAKKNSKKKRTRSEVERLKISVAFEGESNEEEENDETDSVQDSKPHKNSNQEDLGEAESGTTASRPRRKTSTNFRFVPE